MIPDEEFPIGHARQDDDALVKVCRHIADFAYDEALSGQQNKLTGMTIN